MDLETVLSKDKVILNSFLTEEDFSDEGENKISIKWKFNLFSRKDLKLKEIVKGEKSPILEDNWAHNKTALNNRLALRALFAPSGFQKLPVGA